MYLLYVALNTLQHAVVYYYRYHYIGHWRIFTLECKCKVEKGINDQQQGVNLYQYIHPCHLSPATRNQYGRRISEFENLHCDNKSGQ